MDAWQDVEILLVEDNADDAEIALRTLSKGGLLHKILHVRDGAAALAFLFREGEFARRDIKLPKLILLDLKMPKVSGLEVLQRVKQSSVTKAITVVVLTAADHDRERIDSGPLSADGYMVKPITAEAVIDFLKRSAASA